MTLIPHLFARGGAVALLVAASPLLAQSTTSGGAAPGGRSAGATSGSAGFVGSTPAAVIAPASGGQVGQAPQNSAMRNAGSATQRARTAGAATVNPMGMAGMGGGAGALSLSSARGQGQPGGQQGQAAQSTTRITDTGVTQRTSSDSAASP